MTAFLLFLIDAELVTQPLRYENVKGGGQDEPIEIEDSSEDDIQETRAHQRKSRAPFGIDANVDIGDEGFEFMGSHRVTPLPMPEDDLDALLQDEEAMKDAGDDSIETITEVHITPRPPRLRPRPSKGAIAKSKEVVTIPESDEDSFFNRAKGTAPDQQTLSAMADTIMRTTSDSIMVEAMDMQNKMSIGQDRRDTVGLASDRQAPEHLPSSDEIQMVEVERQITSRVNDTPLGAVATLPIVGDETDSEEVDELDSDMDSSESERDELISSSEREDTAMTDVDEAPTATEKGISKIMEVEKLTDAGHEGEASREEGANLTTQALAMSLEASQDLLSASKTQKCTYDTSKAVVYSCYECREVLHSHTQACEEPVKYDLLYLEGRNAYWRYFQWEKDSTRPVLMTRRTLSESDSDDSKSTSSNPSIHCDWAETIVEETYVVPSVNKITAPYQREPDLSSDDEIDFDDENTEDDDAVKGVYEAALVDLGRIVRDEAFFPLLPQSADVKFVNRLNRDDNQAQDQSTTWLLRVHKGQS